MSNDKYKSDKYKDIQPPSFYFKKENKFHLFRFHIYSDFYEKIEQFLLRRGGSFDIMEVRDNVLEKILINIERCFEIYQKDGISGFEKYIYQIIKRCHYDAIGKQYFYTQKIKLEGFEISIKKKKEKGIGNQTHMTTNSLLKNRDFEKFYVAPDFFFEYSTVYGRRLNKMLVQILEELKTLGLNDTQYQAFKLNFHGHKQSQAADKLDIKVSNFKRYLFRVRKNFHKLLVKHLNLEVDTPTEELHFIVEDILIVIRYFFEQESPPEHEMYWNFDCSE